MYKKKLKAGILLYAVFMAAVFSLLLQFYLNRQVSQERIHLLNQERSQAYAMAVFARDKAEGDRGQLAFQEGTVRFQQEDSFLKVTSDLTAGRSYSFTFVRKKPAQEDKKQEKGRKKAAAKAGDQKPSPEEGSERSEAAGSGERPGSGPSSGQEIQVPAEAQAVSGQP